MPPRCFSFDTRFFVYFVAFPYIVICWASHNWQTKRKLLRFYTTWSQKLNFFIIEEINENATGEGSETEGLIKNQQNEMLIGKMGPDWKAEQSMTCNCFDLADVSRTCIGPMLFRGIEGFHTTPCHHWWHDFFCVIFFFVVHFFLFWKFQSTIIC